MRFATALMVIAVLGMASSAQAAFLETFDGGGFTEGGAIAGVNGWTTGGWRGGKQIRPSSLTTSAPPAANSLSSGFAGVQNSGGDPGDSFGRDISGDFVNDQIEVTFDGGGGSFNRFSFGALDNITNGNGPNHYLYFQFANNSNTVDITVANADDDRVVGDTQSAPHMASGEYQGRIRVNRATGLTELDHRALSTDPWTNVYSLNPVTDGTGITWYNTIDAMSINQQGGPWIDNINISGGVIPEPSSMTLLVLGGLMMMMRRRRRV